MDWTQEEKEREEVGKCNFQAVFLVHLNTWGTQEKEVLQVKIRSLAWMYLRRRSTDPQGDARCLVLELKKELVQKYKCEGQQKMQ